MCYFKNKWDGVLSVECWLSLTHKRIGMPQKVKVNFCTCTISFCTSHIMQTSLLALLCRINFPLTPLPLIYKKNEQSEMFSPHVAFFLYQSLYMQDIEHYSSRMFFRSQGKILFKDIGSVSWHQNARGHPYICDCIYQGPAQHWLWLADMSQQQVTTLCFWTPSLAILIPIQGLGVPSFPNKNVP